MEYVTKGRVSSTTILIDEEDFDLVDSYSWSVYDSGYARGYKKSEGCKSEKVLMHRLVMGLPPKHILCDHKDRNTRNNQKSNLRLCSRNQNNRNRCAKKNGRSKYLGVSFVRHPNKDYIIAKLSINNRQIYLGQFDTEEEAAIAYDKAALQVAGEFANLNFPELQGKEVNQ